MNSHSRESEIKNAVSHMKMNTIPNCGGLSINLNSLNFVGLEGKRARHRAITSANTYYYFMNFTSEDERYNRRD